MRLPHQRDRLLPRLHHGRTGVDADPRIKLRQLGTAEALAQRLQALQEAEAGQGGAVCGVFVGHRVAEAGQQPLLAALHDGPIESVNCLLAEQLEGSQHLGLVLGVEVLQVRLGFEHAATANQDGYLPALGFLGAASGGGRHRGRLR